jgi:hypothetical protein
MVRWKPVIALFAGAAIGAAIMAGFAAQIVAGFATQRAEEFVREQVYGSTRRKGPRRCFSCSRQIRISR